MIITSSRVETEASAPLRCSISTSFLLSDLGSLSIMVDIPLCEGRFLWLIWAEVKVDFFGGDVTLFPKAPPRFPLLNELILFILKLLQVDTSFLFQLEILLKCLFKVKFLIN